MDSVSYIIVTYLPAIVMLIVGFALVVVEMYIPGFGVPGTLGIILLVLGVVATKPTPLQALIMAVIIIVLLCIALSICIHSVSKGRLSQSNLVLKETATRAEADAENQLNFFIGREGVARTVLRPAGIAEFDGVKLNVVSEGRFYFHRFAGARGASGRKSHCGSRIGKGFFPFDRARCIGFPKKRFLRKSPIPV